MLISDCEQVEHGSDWLDDILPWSGRQHSGAAWSSCQVWEQDPDTYQDRPQLKDAEPISTGRVLHTEGARRSRHVVNGPRADSTVWSALVQADRCWHHTFQVRYEPWGRSADPKSLQVTYRFSLVMLLSPSLVLLVLECTVSLICYTMLND